mgnify:CR=1 FL=1
MMRAEALKIDREALLAAALRGAYPDERGRYGPFGGRYVPETLVPALDRLGEATPLEAVAIAGVPREALQPRFSELRAMGLIEPTGTPNTGDVATAAPRKTA